MRKYLSLYFILFLLALLNVSQGFASACECPTLACDACEDQTDVQFYSEKCDAAKVRSCVKPICKAKDPMPAGCENYVAKKGADAAPAAKAEAVKVETAVVDSNVEIGSVEETLGTAWVIDLHGKKQPAKAKMKVYESDKIVTEKGSKLKLIFSDRNELIVSEDSEVKISEYKMSQQAEKRKALLNLLKGQLRSNVKQKYEGTKTSAYEIKTPTAVAGVRGTTFVVAYEQGDKLITKIQTLEGKVNLHDDGDGTKALDVKAGESASFVVASNDLFDENEMRDFIAKGYMTPVYKMNADEIKKLDWDSELQKKDTKREVASDDKSKHLCREPRGEFNQCAWVCENNPKGEKVCRTDLPQVNCVRRRCNANGAWAEETRLPASLTEECKGDKARVAPCNY